MFKFTYILLASVLALPVSAQTLDRIQQTGEIRLGFRTDAAPLSFADRDGNPAGYSPLVCVSVAQGIANFLHMENLSVTFHDVDTSNRFDKVANGDIDLLCGAATITLKRREKVDFSVPTYVDGTAVMVAKGTQSDLASLAGKKIGVRAGTTTMGALNTTLEDSNIDADVIVFDDHAAGLAAVESAQITAYFADQAILFFLLGVSENPANLKVSGEILTIEKQGLAMARGDSDFRLLVDAVLSEMFASGTMEKIFTTTLPGASPGAAIRAMYLTSPTVP